MGSFSLACAFSNLPIEAGDDVRFLLLTQNRFHQGAGHTCYMYDRWSPRVIPLRAKYNDYGSVEDVEEGPQQDVWLKGFGADLHELGVGENTCHDVATSRDMTFNQMLEAVWEGRLLVEDDVKLPRLVSTATDAEHDAREKPGIPTIYRIKKLIADNGLKLAPGMHTEGYFVDSTQFREVRVRNAQFADVNGDAEALKKVQDLIGDSYTSAIFPGSNCTIDGGAELIVRSRLGTENGGVYRREPAPTVLPVAQAMIREDVWQHMLTCELTTWRHSKKLSVADYKSGVREYARLWMEYENSDNSSLSSIMRQFEIEDKRRDIEGAWIFDDRARLMRGPGAHFDLIMRSGGDTTAFLDSAAEFAWVTSIAHGLRVQWSPAHGSGGQGGEWKNHAKFHTAMGKIARAVEKEKRW